MAEVTEAFQLEVDGWNLETLIVRCWLYRHKNVLIIGLVALHLPMLWGGCPRRPVPLKSPAHLLG